MTNTIILIIAGTLLWSYVVDIAAKRYSIPAVIPLVASGLIGNYFLHASGQSFDWLNASLPVLGTIGLILIVLEGALDLQLRSENAGLMRKAMLSAVLGFTGCAVFYTLLAQWLFSLDLYAAGALAIPFAVISSAVAIPSGRALDPAQSEFVVYESSISDILGVLVFFAWFSAAGSMESFALDLGSGSVISLVLGVLFSLLLLWLLGRVTGHIRFLPILAMLFMLYAIGKAVHLSPLILVLGFGLLLNNAELLKRSKHLARLVSPDHQLTVDEFKTLVTELEFAIRSIFFIMLGLWTPLDALRDSKAWLTAIIIIGILLVWRYILLKVLRLDVNKVIWLAPRGLITVLLLLTAMESIEIGGFPRGAVMLTVLLSCLLVLLARPDKVKAARIASGEGVSGGKSPDSA